MKNEPPIPGPAVRSKIPIKPRTIIIAVVVLALISAGAWVFWGRPGDTSQKSGEAGDAARTAKPDGQRPAGPGAPGGTPGGGRFGGDPNRVQNVTAVPARVGDINIVQNGLGTVTALRTANVKARVDGLLLNVFFKEGQLAKAGDVLAEIDSRPLEAQLEQVEGQMARDQALLANAKLDLERYRTLLAQDSIAKQQLDSQASLVRQYEGTLKSDQGQVDNARLQLGYTKIRAPISGRLGLRQIDAGNIIHAGDANGLVVITQIDPITVLFTIPQDNLQRVLKQLNAGEKLVAEVWDREQKMKLAIGMLLTTDNQIDIATGTVKLKAQFPNPDGALFPNQFVNVRMVVDTNKGATVIPTAAIQRGTQGTIVYVVKPDKTVAMRPVKLGPVEGEIVAVESGVSPGENVVIDGIDRLREGAKVEVSAPLKFVPPAEGRDPSKRGQRKGDGKGAPDGARIGPTGAADGKPGAPTATVALPASSAPEKGKSPSAKDPAPSPAIGQGPPGRQMTDEQKAAWKNMTDEQKAEMRKRRRAAEESGAGKN